MPEKRDVQTSHWTAHLGCAAATRDKDWTHPALPSRGSHASAPVPALLKPNHSNVVSKPGSTEFNSGPLFALT